MMAIPRFENYNAENSVNQCNESLFMHEFEQMF